MLKEMDIDRSEFEEKFEKYVKKPESNIATYILLEFEKHFGVHPDVNPAPCITLEHVLPDNYTEDEWSIKDFFNLKGPEIAKSCETKMKQYRNHLGNMGLLPQKLNSELQNKSFEKKKNGEGGKPGYNDLLLNINSDLKGDEWTQKTIDDRDEYFIDKAREVWEL